jgi:hypothetical protein
MFQPWAAQTAPDTAMRVHENNRERHVIERAIEAQRENDLLVDFCSTENLGNDRFCSFVRQRARPLLTKTFC